MVPQGLGALWRPSKNILGPHGALPWAPGEHNLALFSQASLGFEAYFPLLGVYEGFVKCLFLFRNMFDLAIAIQC